MNNLPLQLLQEEYNTLLNQYQSTYQSYVEHKNSPTLFISVKDKSWWGSSSISEGVVENEDKCMTECSNNPECSGATFDPENNYCWVRNGKGTLSSNPETVAIVNALQNDLRVLRTINAKLLDINERIHQEMINNEPNVDALYTKEEEIKSELTKQSENLDVEESKLSKLSNEYDTIEEGYDYQSKYVDQQNIIFRILFIFAIMLSIAVIHQLFESVLWKYIGYFIIFVIIVMFINT